MPTIQGEFRSGAAGQRAVDALVSAGVPQKSIRCWNIVPEAASEPASSGNTYRGAILGRLAGGLPGLAAGAAIGNSLDESAGNEGPFPASRGVRVVVDTTPGAPDVVTILRDAGAANVRTISE